MNDEELSQIDEEINETEKVRSDPPRYDKMIEAALETDDVPTLIRLINLRVDPVKFAIKANPPIPVAVFLAYRRLILTQMFSSESGRGRIFEQVRKVLRKPIHELERTREYVFVKASIDEAIEMIYSIDGIASAAKKFEPQIAKEMVSTAFLGGRDANKILMDLGDRAAPKPQRQSNNQVVYVLPGGDIAALQASRRLGETQVTDDDAVSATVLNVPRISE